MAYLFQAFPPAEGRRSTATHIQARETTSLVMWQYRVSWQRWVGFVFFGR